MEQDDVTTNLEGMNVLDFEGWNSADWHGVPPSTTPTTCTSTGRVRNRLEESSNTSTP